MHICKALRLALLTGVMILHAMVDGSIRMLSIDQAFLQAAAAKRLRWSMVVPGVANHLLDNSVHEQLLQLMSKSVSPGQQRAQLLTCQLSKLLMQHS